MIFSRMMGVWAVFGHRKPMLSNEQRMNKQLKNEWGRLIDSPPWLGLFSWKREGVPLFLFFLQTPQGTPNGG